ncbi:MAG: nitroreductase family deazaflavin-dependent oxidoreductase [Candidatus Limnocylindrales bacterium]
MGPNVLLTVKGRTSGEPRSAPVAIVEIDGRRWIMGAYGEAHWVQNLRAAGEADLLTHGRTEHVRATELDRAAAVEFFRHTLPGFIGRLPWFGRAFGRALFSLVAREIVHDPERAALTRPVFELLPAR